MNTEKIARTDGRRSQPATTSTRQPDAKKEIILRKEVENLPEKFSKL